jgi:hypothetical protein
MKFLSKILFAVLATAAILTACTKAEQLPFYGETTGTTPVLSASVATLAPAPADSMNTGITFNWTNPKYATDSANQKFIIEIDSTGRNFSKAVSFTVNGSLSKPFINKDINNILLGFGFAFNVAYDVDVRVTSSYANNNEKLTSNVLKVRMTPYKVPPKIALPTTGKLFIVGDATDGGWNNPVPTPSQELARINETTWVGIFNITGAKQYLILPANGDWSNKFSVANNTLPGLSGGGDFGFNLNDNFPGPTTSGMYKITLDFQQGKFTCEPYTGPNLATNLFMVGDATPGGWNNPVPTPSQQFTRLNSVEFSLTLNGVIGAKEYLILPVNGDWSNKYSVANKSLTGLNTGGAFGYNLPDNFPGPTTNGNYRFDVNFATATFKVTKL